MGPELPSFWLRGRLGMETCLRCKYAMGHPASTSLAATNKIIEGNLMMTRNWIKIKKVEAVSWERRD